MGQYCAIPVGRFETIANTQCLDGRREAAPVLQIVRDRELLLALRIPRRARVPGRQTKALLVLVVPVLERVLGWKTKLSNRQSDPFAELDVELDRSKPILVRKHELPL